MIYVDGVRHICTGHMVTQISVSYGVLFEMLGMFIYVQLGFNVHVQSMML